MPGPDWIPVVSQVKAGIQLLTGDVDGAAQTSENFMRECPVVSQVTSLGQLIAGDPEGALETQQRCLETVNNVANSVPVVGHVKGAIHHMVGDHEGGNQALNAASRSTVVLGAGAAAGLSSGGLAAIPAGIAAGTAYDAVESAVVDEPRGVFAAIDNAVNSPSAGTIFDTGIIFVGDGFAGYSGGRMAVKLNTRLTLSKLESTRAALLEKLNDSASSGQAFKLGEQINVLTRQINAITHGTPQYWYDPKTGQTTVGKPASNSAVPVVANMGQGDRGKEGQIFKEIYRLQEDAFSHDFYESVPTEGQQTYEQKREQLRRYNSQQTPQTSLDRAYRNLEKTKWERINEMKRSLQRNPERERGNLEAEELFRNRWVHVPMPREFPFTGAAMINNTTQGLLHTFIRHSDQWMQLVPELQQVWNNLQPVHQHLHNIVRASNDSQSRQAISDFDAALLNFNPAQYSYIIVNLIEAQELVYTYLRNVTRSYPRYVGNGINYRGHQQIYFEVTNSRGQSQIMVVCVSDQLYVRDQVLTNDPRPIRTITTIFFIPNDNNFRRRYFVERSF